MYKRKYMYQEFKCKNYVRKKHKKMNKLKGKRIGRTITGKK
jgi:hypothetical protein